MKEIELNADGTPKMEELEIKMVMLLVSHGVLESFVQSVSEEIVVNNELPMEGDHIIIQTDSIPTEVFEAFNKDMLIPLNNEEFGNLLSSIIEKGFGALKNNQETQNE